MLQLTITLHKKVPDEKTGLVIYDLVKQRLADRPDVTMTGHMTYHFDIDGPEEPE